MADVEAKLAATKEELAATKEELAATQKALADARTKVASVVAGLQQPSLSAEDRAQFELNLSHLRTAEQHLSKKKRHLQETQEQLHELATLYRRMLIEMLRADAVAGLGPQSTAASGDTTAAYLKMCLTPFEGSRLRMGVDLPRLEDPLQPRLPLPCNDADKLFQERDELRDLLVSAAEPQAATAHELTRHVGYVVAAYKPGAGTSEMYVAGSTMMVVEGMLTLIMQYVPGPVIRMDRNTADTSGATAKRLRPDFMCWVNGALLFKGEEKASEADLPLAVEELKGKISDTWAGGLLPGVQAPCMLAFAAAGPQLQFFCIKRSGPGSQPLVQSMSSVLDLRLPVARARAINATCNVYRLMVGFADTMKAVVPFALGGVIKSKQGSVLLLPGFVRKEVWDFAKKHARFATFELLRDVYAAMSKHKGCIIQACGPGADSLPELRDATYVVHLAPVGVPIRGPPSTESELVHAVRGALTGLAAMHSEGFVHRDVRWPNLIRLPADGQWLLVDLEHAGKQGDCCSQEPYPLHHWSQDMLTRDGTYTAASDLHMVADQLLSAVPFQLSDDASDLRQRLCEGNLSAVDALQHSWFAAQRRGLVLAC